MVENKQNYLDHPDDQPLKQGEVALREFFASLILDTVEGRNIDSITEESLKTGYGAYGALDKLLREYHRTKDKDRHIFARAIGTLLEDTSVKPYTKAALLLLFGGGMDLKEAEPSVEILNAMPEASDPLLEERLYQHFRSRAMTEWINEFAAPSPQQEVELSTKDLEISDFEKKHHPNLTRSVVEGWLVDTDIPFEDHYKYHFYEPGKPRNTEYLLMYLNINTGQSRGVNELDLIWSSQINTKKFISVANRFIAKVAGYPEIPRTERIRRETAGRSISDPFSPVGVNIHPGPLEDEITLELPDPKVGISYDQLVQAISSRIELEAYSINNSFISITTPSCLLTYSPLGPLPRPPFDFKPKATTLSLQQHPATMAEVVFPTLKESSTYNFPWDFIKNILDNQYAK